MKTYFMHTESRFENATEAAAYLYEVCGSRENVLTENETSAVVKRFAKRYELTFGEAICAIKGLAYSEAAKRFLVALDTNFGQFSLTIKAKTN
jgi:hypothetical protein